MPFQVEQAPLDRKGSSKSPMMMGSLAQPVNAQECWATVGTTKFYSGRALKYQGCGSNGVLPQGSPRISLSTTFTQSFPFNKRTALFELRVLALQYKTLQEKFLWRERGFRGARNQESRKRGRSPPSEGGNDEHVGAF